MSIRMVKITNAQSPIVFSVSYKIIVKKRFKRPSLNKDGSIYADEAIHNVTNIEIACDLSDESVDEWGSDMAEEYRQQLMTEKK